MNREIKFEICTRRKDGTDLFVERLTLDELIDRNGCYYNPKVQEIVYKRQYTGLKDKNEVEIYEGDGVGFICWIGEKIYFQIEWSDTYGGWWAKSLHKGSLDWPVVEMCNKEAIKKGKKVYKFKVIGNIYENLELIK